MAKLQCPVSTRFAEAFGMQVTICRLTTNEKKFLWKSKTLFACKETELTLMFIMIMHITCLVGRRMRLRNKKILCFCAQTVG